MKRSRWLTAGAAMLATIAQAQVALSPDINFFGDDLPQQNQGGARGRKAAAQEARAKPSTEGYSQTLVFSDGRELRGELGEIAKDEIIWRRPDAGDALRFARGDVRRIVTEAAGRDAANGLVPAFAGNPFNQPKNQGKTPDKPLSATLKLPGGDWLFGHVTSADGETFAVQLEGGTSLTVSRPQIEWMHFGHAAVPAFGFTGTALDMEGWSPASAAMELAGDTLTVKGAAWIGRTISPPNRFEVSFELPEDSEEGTRFWLQPFGPQPNCYGTGTAEMRFGRKEISHMLFIDKFERQSLPLPVEALNDKGPSKYRVFYDGTEKRVIVRRNGREVGDWKFFAQKDQQVDEANRNFQFNGLCFDREDRGQSGTLLKFNRLRIQPWDGILPKEGEADDGQDRLSEGEAPSLGKLESVSEKELGFSGAQRPLRTGAFLRLSGAQLSALAGAEARLEFGKQGEFTARNVEIREGKLRCETSFASLLELPLGALQRITFPARRPPASSPVDILVFKNCDELPGKALSAALSGPVRWRTARGQEVEFQPGRIAGIRLAAAGEAKGARIADSAATVELRTGERLRGKLVAFDEKQVRLEHAQLGSIALDRSRLWHLFPNPRLAAVDGGRTPGGWNWMDPASQQEDGKKKSWLPERWVYLDGTYLLRSDGNTSFSNTSELPALQYEINPSLERFEMRIEAASPFGSSPNFLLLLSGKNTPSLNATFSYSDLQLVVIDPRGRQQANWRDIPLQEKLGNMNARRALRLFVDTRTGTCDIVINGVHITRLGQNESERLVKSQYTARIQPYPTQGGPAIFSNLWIGPWNGELPLPGNAADGSTALANGDVAPGLPKGLHDGKLTIESELGELSLPVEKALAIDFGGVIDSPHAAARLRFADGTTVNVDDFHWDGRELTAHSTLLGDLHLPAAAVNELIYDPALPRPPMAPTTKKVAQKNAENTNMELLR